jgi:hypothetical protein
MKHTGSTFKGNRSIIGSFKAGDRVRCLANCKFPDGSRHLLGRVYTITPATLEYYNARPTDYALVFAADPPVF